MTRSKTLILNPHSHCITNNDSPIIRKRWLYTNHFEYIKYRYNNFRQPLLCIGGFRSSRIRALVWPKLLGIDSKDLAIHYRTFLHSYNTTATENEKEAVFDHRDLPQVRCDVDRSLYSIYQVKHWTDEQRNERRIVLTDIIIAVMTKNEDKYYYYQVWNVWSTNSIRHPYVINQFKPL